MANLDQIQLPDNTTYDIISKTGRGLVRATMNDTTSTSTAFVVEASGITSLYDGLTIVVKNTKVTSASGCTLQLNDLAAKRIIRSNGGGYVTTHWGLNTTYLFVYSETNDRWEMQQGYLDGNTNTWRGINVDGTALLGTGTGTGAINFISGDNVTLTGSGNDLTIASTDQVNADWNASSGVAQILNKPSLATVATSGSYSDLSGRPTIPTKTSDLTNDAGFIIADSPSLTGTPTSTTPPLADDSTKIATTAYVQNELDDYVEKIDGTAISLDVNSLEVTSLKIVDNVTLNADSKNDLLSELGIGGIRSYAFNSWHNGFVFRTDADNVYVFIQGWYGDTSGTISATGTATVQWKGLFSGTFTASSLSLSNVTSRRYGTEFTFTRPSTVSNGATGIVGFSGTISW